MKLRCSRKLGWLIAVGGAVAALLPAAARPACAFTRADADAAVNAYLKAFVRQDGPTAFIKGDQNGGDMKALSKELPGLTKLAGIVRGKPISGVHLLKPANSEPFEEEWVCSFLGNLGIPLVPAGEINAQAASAVFPVQALKDPNFPGTLQRMLTQGTPVVITDGLAKRLSSHPDILKNENLTVLNVQGNPRTLLKLTREEIKPLREKLLAPMGMTFDAPNKVELYLFGDSYFILENINDEAVDVTLDLPHVSTVRTVLTLPEDEGTADLSLSGKSVKIQNLSPRSLVAVECH